MLPLVRREVPLRDSMVGVAQPAEAEALGTWPSTAGSATSACISATAEVVVVAVPSTRPAVPPWV